MRAQRRRPQPRRRHRVGPQAGRAPLPQGEARGARGWKSELSVGIPLSPTPEGPGGSFLSYSLFIFQSGLGVLTSNWGWGASGVSP